MDNYSILLSTTHPHTKREECDRYMCGSVDHLIVHLWLVSGLFQPVKWKVDEDFPHASSTWSYDKVFDCFLSAPSSPRSPPRHLPNCGQGSLELIALIMVYENNAQNSHVLAHFTHTHTRAFVLRSSKKSKIFPFIRSSES